MIPAIFTKPIESIEADDVQELVTRSWPESAQVEFKQDLSTKSGKPNSQPGNDAITENARDEILSELIAFANSQGGTLVLGIEETTDKPARAYKVTELQKVGELARSFEDMIRDCIDPKLSLFHVKAVQTNGDSGVIVFRVPASIAAPHRICTKKNQQAYIRHGLSTTTMTMRQIQDLTLDRARGAVGLEKVFQQHQANFITWGSSNNKFPCFIAYRVTAVPIAPLPNPGRIYGTQFSELCWTHTVSINKRSETLGLDINGSRQRPILRGTERFNESDFGTYKFQVYQDGVVNLCLAKYDLRNLNGVDEVYLFHSGYLAGVISTLRGLDNFRKRVGIPFAEYAIETEIRVFHKFTQRPIYVGFGDRNNSTSIRMLNDTVILPRLTVESENEFNIVLETIHTDVYDAMGISNSPKYEFEVIRSEVFT